MSTTMETETGALSTEQDTKQFSFRAQRASFWNGSAPKKVIRENNWDSWVRYLAKRSKPISLDHICCATTSSLSWGLETCHTSPDSNSLLQLLIHSNGNHDLDRKSTRSELQKWLAHNLEQVHSVDYAIECLAVVHLLPRIASIVDYDLWWSLINVLWKIVSRTEDWQIDVEMPAEKCLVHQLLAGELPLTLAYMFPEMRPLAKLRKSAHDPLSEGLIELTNGEGLPKSSHLSVFRALLACWTRCRAMGSASEKRPWNRKAEEQFHWAVSKAVICSSSTGAPLLGNEEARNWAPDFLKAILYFGGNTADETAALDMYEKKLSKHLSGKSGNEVPETSYQCEWSGLSILRTEFSRTAPVVAVDYASPDLRIDVWCGTQRLMSGVWSAQTETAGKNLEPIGVWEQTCWFSDEDVDYLELAIDLSDGARLDRQILLAREDLFLLLVDHVLNASGDTIHHEFNLPLASEVQFAHEAETREGLLIADKPIARVLPLALPEWRSDPRIGQLTQVEGYLKLDQRRPGKGLACPLFIDLDPARLGRQCTWRQLTVAQSLEIQPHDVAVGYRVQCGKSQWLIYRSLDKAANRTVLGQNTSVESLVGRFLAPSGEVEELLEVEG